MTKERKAINKALAGGRGETKKKKNGDLLTKGEVYKVKKGRG